MLSVRIAALIGGLLVLAHLFLMFTSLRDEREGILAIEKMRKLASIAIQNFPDRKVLSDRTFWKSLGREGDPIKDSWETGFRLEHRGGGFFWKSAGADRAFGTRDDLEVKVPFVDGPAPDLGPPEGYTGFPAMDAK